MLHEEGERGPMAVESGEHDAAELEAGYVASHRRYELASIVLTTSAAVWLLVRILESRVLSGWWVPLAALVGMLASDFTSGFVHWMFDTWGSVDTPVFGRLAIRTFRHHHVDARAITRHDFVETNGHNFGLCSWVAIVGAFWVQPETASLFDVFLGMSALGLVIFTCLTSQIHKWAHMESPPRVVQLLQRARLILAPEHHATHHKAPYARSYCITVGWLNGPLRAVRFFETLERIISAVTGMVPRADDLGEEAALQVAAELSRDSEDKLVAAPEAVAARD